MKDGEIRSRDRSPVIIVCIYRKRSNSMETLLKPSTFIPKGIQVEQINNLTLFKFTEELGDRLQDLLDRKKANLLSAEESIELATIGELDEIFSYINAVIAAEANADRISLRDSAERTICERIEEGAIIRAERDLALVEELRI
jgi:hypothetical protein